MNYSSFDSSFPIQYYLHSKSSQCLHDNWQTSLPENINSANDSALKICDLISGIYERHYISIELITNLSFVIFAQIYSSDALGFLHIEMFLLGLDTEELDSERSHKSSCSSIRSVCLQCHSFSDLISPPLPSPEEMTHFVRLYFSSQHRVLSLPTHTSLCLSYRNLRLGEIFRRSVCGKAIFWHFTRIASRIQIRTSHSQRKILTLTSQIFPTNLFFASSPPKWTKLNQGHPVKQIFAVCFIFSNTYISSEIAIENFWNNQSFILYLLISREKLN